MREMGRLLSNAIAVSLFILLAGIATTLEAQGRMTIQATAMGTSTQMGQIYSVNILVDQFSTPDDQKALIDAFQRSGQEGLLDVLEHMKPKGRIRFASGGVGNDIKYIIELPSANGRRFRFLTDRNISIREQRRSNRSEEYSVGAIELVLTPEGQGSGTLLPACKLTVDKKTQQIEVDAYQNPWKLTNIRVAND
jgi:hypothetical protein